MGNALTRLLGRDKGRGKGRGKGSDEPAAPEQGEDAASDAPDAPDAPEAEASTDAFETGDTSGEAKAAKPRVTAQVSGLRSRFGAWLGRPMTSFHLIIAIAGLLTTLGLIMVLSASGVRSYGADGSAWVIFGKQVLWTVIGVIAAYLAMRVSVRFIRRVAFTGYVVTIILLVLVLVPGIGNLANGSRKWFVIAGFSMQPS